MNLPSTRHATKYRKIAVSFRDAQLLPIFQFALTTLKSLLQASGIAAACYRNAEKHMTTKMA
jgi:exportin-7